jgi:hypothetical protein
MQGRTYRGVRGLEPFYLKLPLLNAILFVTNTGRDSLAFHVIALSNLTEMKIPGEKLSFGNHIGYPDSPGSPYTDYVDKESSKELVIATRYPHARTRVFLDLQAKEIAKVDYDEFDEVGNVKAHSVYVRGKQIQ